MRGQAPRAGKGKTFKSSDMLSIRHVARTMQPASLAGNDRGVA
jgi:hypothetical protein